MSEHDMWALECPHCQKEIKQQVDWFKQDKVTCPACEAELPPEEIEKIMEKIKEKFIDPEDEIEFNF